MIAYHNPEILGKMITASSLNQCEGIENSAKYHVDKADRKMLKKKSFISKIGNDSVEKERKTPQRVATTNNQLKSSGIKIYNVTHS